MWDHDYFSLRVENLLDNKILIGDICNLIEEAHSSVATVVNATRIMLYWRVGKRINEEILTGDQAGYGEKIVHSLSAKLQQEY